MKPLVNVTPIGTWDHGRMRSCAYMKEGGFAREASFWGLGAEEKEAKFLVIFILFFVVGDVCISVLDKL
jgi:hypothetical protein